MNEVIPGGWIKLLDSMGTDLDIVNSARISFHTQHQKMEEGDDKLIHFLLRNRHGSPFEIPMFRWQVHCPITVAREWFRHRISSFNEVSGRYVEMQKDAYVPTGDFIRSQKGKPGNYRFEPITDANVVYHIEQTFIDHYEECWKRYKDLLQLGLAKELARSILPQGMFTEFIYQANARSVMNFLSLRNAPNAMLEIQCYARRMEEDFAKVLPITYEAFVEHGRITP